MFGKVKSLRNAIKSKFSCNGWGTGFDGGLWSFDNDFARNVIIFGADNSSSSHTDNQKNKFLVLGEGHTDKFNLLLLIYILMNKYIRGLHYYLQII